jgi:hypothetical protein
VSTRKMLSLEEIKAWADTIEAQSTSKLIKFSHHPARKEELIDYKPFVAADALKSEKVEKDCFTPEQVQQRSWSVIRQACGCRMLLACGGVRSIQKIAWSFSWKARVTKSIRANSLELINADGSL